jgi:N-acetyl-anhydromuramyl-L-alanine amidase AmpD
MQLRKGKIQFGIIHHPGRLNEYTAEEVKKVHLARGFGDVGYNYLIEEDGKIVKGRDEKYRGAHTVVEGSADPQYWNENALGICFVHNGEEGPFPDVMYKSAAKLLKEKGLKPAQIRLHREVDNTVCPGKYFEKEKMIKYLQKEWNGSLHDYEGHWAQKQIEYCLKENIMQGYTDGTFRPEKALTRAEAADLAVQLEKRIIEKIAMRIKGEV